MNLHFILLIVLIFASSVKNKTIKMGELKLISDYANRQTNSLQIIIFSCTTSIYENNIIFTYFNKFNIRVVTKTSNKLNWKLQKITLFTILSNCKDINLLLKQAEELDLFQIQYFWLVFNEMISSNFSILINSNFVVCTQKTNTTYVLKTIYKRSKNDTSYSQNLLATYENGFKPNFTPILIGRDRLNIHQTNISVTYFLLYNTPSIFDFQHYRETHINSISKFGYIICWLMLEKINANPHFYLSNDWGYRTPNSTNYNGMVGEIQNGNAELIGTSLYSTIDRLDVLQYSSITSPSLAAFMFRNPPLCLVENLFTLPFDKNLWYSSYVVSVVVIVVLFLIVVFENRMLSIKKTNSNVGKIRSNLSDVVMVQIGAITQQGSDVEPNSASGRIASFFTLLVLTFLYTAYSANIVVLLQSTSTSIQTVDDLLNSKIELGVYDLSFSRHWFAKETRPIQKALYDKKIAQKNQKDNFVKSLETGILRMKNEFYAFHFELVSGYQTISNTWLEHQICGINVIDYLKQLPPSIAFGKNTPYKEQFKIGLFQLRESGIYKRQTNRVYPKRPTCTSKKSIFISVGINESYFAFVLFLFGIGVAFVLLIFEILFKKYWFELKSCNSKFV